MSREKVPSNMHKIDSDHPAHAQSMIWAFALQSYILYNPMIWLISDSKSPDQTASVQADLGQRHFFAWCGPHFVRGSFVVDNHHVKEIPSM